MSTFDENKVARTPAGSSDGGKFANKDSQREEAGQVALYESSVDLLEDDDLLAHGKQWGRWIIHNSPEPNYSESEEDLAMEVVLEALEKREQVKNGHRLVHIEKPYVAKIARSKAREVIAKRIHPNDRKARAILLKKEDEYAQEHGRAMSAAERAQLVRDITMAEPPGRRPIKGWEDRDKRGQDIPLMVAGREGGETFNTAVEGLVEHHDTYSFERVEDPWAAADVTPSKDEAWEALRIMRDLPPVATDTITPSRARTVSRDIGSGGGASIVFKRWQEGDLGDDDPEVKAAFAPFGEGISAQEADAVATMMVDSRGNADNLWRSCLKAATR